MAVLVVWLSGRGDDAACSPHFATVAYMIRSVLQQSAAGRVYHACSSASSSAFTFNPFFAVSFSTLARSFFLKSGERCSLRSTPTDLRPTRTHGHAEPHRPPHLTPPRRGCALATPLPSCKLTLRHTSVYQALQATIPLRHIMAKGTATENAWEACWGRMGSENDYVCSPECFSLLPPRWALAHFRAVVCAVVCALWPAEAPCCTWVY